MLGQANMYDVLLSNVVIFACGQLRHLKEILRPLMELSAAFSPASGITPSAGKIFTTQSAFSAKHNLGMPGTAPMQQQQKKKTKKKRE